MRDNIQGGALTETTFLVLLATYEPRHGYAIMQFLRRATDERVDLGAGTLYGALNALAKRGWIAPVGDASNAKTKTYIITEEGRRSAERELRRLEGIHRLASSIIEGGSAR